MAQERVIKVLSWSEMSEPKEAYPEGINGAVAEVLNACPPASPGRNCPGIEAKVSSIDDPEQGLSEANLAEADVLFWWGHVKHGQVNDEYAARVVKQVTERGMGFVPLHSAHYSKPFKALMGTDCGLGGWREDGKPERIKVLAPDHPIAEGLSDFVIPEDEMYKEPFAVPEPETVVFYSYFQPGEEFRSGCCWTRGKGRIFYFRPGHETFRVMYQPEVKRVLCNAACWAARYV